MHTIPFVRNMTNSKLRFFGPLLLAGCMLLTSCDPCRDVDCVNGECVEGSCVCSAGYEGLDCSTAINAKFSGTYTNSEACTLSQPVSYAVTIAPKSGSPTEITITGLWELPQATVTAQVDDNGTSFTIDNQPLGTYFIVSSGNGSISADGNTITLNYTLVNIPGGPVLIETCYASLSK
jgi:hypothetical protein